ncbi:hypothetical protein D5086_014103 [Populus alba]|uniref:Uncharacterized protein n=1 Tax=Populus alba TaxID=43335 RepID=A0ACC4C780_POPAL
MGRKPRCSADGMNKGAWTPPEDEMLVDYVKIHGEGKWSNIVKETDFFKILDPDFPKLSGLNDITSTANHSTNTIQVDGDHCSVSINGCNPREIAEFSELLEADWTSNKCVQAEQGFDFMSLLSFLDSTDE